MSWLQISCTIFVLVVCRVHTCSGYKPVIFMHGILADSDEGNQLLDWIAKDHPGTIGLTIDAFNRQESIVNMTAQVNEVSSIMQDFMTKHPEGVNLICFSQGGLVCRGVIEQVAHNVNTFISLSCPQAGQFGDTNFLKNFFPTYLRDNLYKALYTETGQKISVGNYWNDPRQQDLYLQWSQYLAVVNNQSVNPNSQKFKTNFTRLKRLVMIGGPDDGVITPWQSSHFGFYDSNLNMVEMKDQPWYQKDSFGLKTLDSRGGLVTHVVPGVMHIHWHSNITVYKNYILPYLD